MIEIRYTIDVYIFFFLMKFDFFCKSSCYIIPNYSRDNIDYVYTNNAVFSKLYRQCLQVRLVGT